MDRRNLVKSVFAAAGAGALAAPAASRAAAEPPGVPRVVYHLSEIERAKFVLGNIRNHIDGMGGPEHVKMALVVHGPPLGLFRAETGEGMMIASTARLVKAGVIPFACRNTMEGLSIALSDLLPGFAVAERGGVVKLAELQAEGWAYLRP